MFPLCVVKCCALASASCGFWAVDGWRVSILGRPRRRRRRGRESVSHSPARPSSRLRRRLPFVYPSGAFNGEENIAFPTGCWQTRRPSPRGAPVVSDNFCSQMAALPPSLSSNSSSTKRTLFFGAAAAEEVGGGWRPFRSAAGPSPAAMDFSLGAHFIKNRST